MDLEANLGFVTGTREEFGEAHALPPLAGARALCGSRMRSTMALMASCILSLWQTQASTRTWATTTIRNPQATRGARRSRTRWRNPWSAVGDHNHY